MLRNNQTGIVGIAILVLIVAAFVVFVVQRSYDANSSDETDNTATVQQDQ